MGAGEVASALSSDGKATGSGGVRKGRDLSTLTHPILRLPSDLCTVGRLPDRVGPCHVPRTQSLPSLTCGLQCCKSAPGKDQSPKLGVHRGDPTFRDSQRCGQH